MTKHGIAEEGLLESLDRLRDRLQGRSTANPVVSLAEVLGWLYALEEHHRDGLGDGPYFALRSASPEGQALGGLIYARGLFTHSLAEVAGLVTVRPGRTITMGGGGGRRGRGGRGIVHRAAVTENSWKLLLELPPPTRPETKGRDAYYRKHVEGKPVLPPIEAAVTFITGVL